jgi:hypothetical protein
MDNKIQPSSKTPYELYSGGKKLVKKKLVKKNKKSNLVLQKSEKVLKEIFPLSKIFLHLLVLGLSGYFYYEIYYKFIMNQEENKCECAIDDWKYEHLKTYVKVNLLLYLIMIILFILVGLLTYFNFIKTLEYTLLILSSILFIPLLLLILYLSISTIILILYLIELYREDCECSNTTRKTIIIALIIINILYSLFNLVVAYK